VVGIDAVSVWSLLLYSSLKLWSACSIAELMYEEVGCVVGVMRGVVGTVGRGVDIAVDAGAMT
jgi:hypothetical protein